MEERLWLEDKQRPHCTNMRALRVFVLAFVWGAKCVGECSESVCALRRPALANTWQCWTGWRPPNSWKSIKSHTVSPSKQLPSGHKDKSNSLYVKSPGKTGKATAVNSGWTKEYVSLFSAEEKSNWPRKVHIVHDSFYTNCFCQVSGLGPIVLKIF